MVLTVECLYKWHNVFQTIQIFFIKYSLVQDVGNVPITRADGIEIVQVSDIISNNASFSNAFANVEPHEHLSGDQSVP